MQHQDQLFELIRSLTPHEKGYIRRMAATHHQDGASKYVRLFDAIEKQKIYDEAALKKKLAKEKFISNFSGAKNYLLHAILRHLESYDTAVQSQVRSLLSQYAILRRKGLFELGYRHLRRAYQLCEENELNYQKPEVLFTLISHTIAYGGQPEWPGGKEALLELVAANSELNLLAAKLRFEIHQLKKQTPGLIRARSNEQVEAIRAKAEKLLELDTARLQSFDTRYQYYQLLTNYYYVCSDIEKGLYYADELCAWLLENWSYAVPQAMPYIAAFYNKALYELLCYRPALKKSLEVLERLIIKEQLGNPDSKILLRRMQLFVAWETCRYEEVHKQVRSNLAFFEKHRALINHPGEELIYRMINACAYFATGKLAEAAREIRALLRHPAEEKAHALSSGARILLLIIEFERGDRLSLDSQLRSAYRYLLKKQQLHKVEKCVLDFLRKSLRKIKNPDGLRDGFIALKAAIEDALTDRNEEMGARLFDLVAFLESKISGDSFAAVRLRNARQNWGDAMELGEAE